MVLRDILQHSGNMSTRSKALDLVVSEALEVPQGTVFTSSHFPHGRINNLTYPPLNGKPPIFAVRIESVK